MPVSSLHGSRVEGMRASCYDRVPTHLEGSQDREGNVTRRKKCGAWMGDGGGR